MQFNRALTDHAAWSRFAPNLRETPNQRSHPFVVRAVYGAGQLAGDYLLWHTFAAHADLHVVRDRRQHTNGCALLHLDAR